MATGTLTLTDVGQFVGRETGVSPWMEITQEQIDAFAEVTGDHQWIHKNLTTAFDGPFGRPICHGLLVLSYAFKLARDAGSLPRSTWIIYGYDNLRFRAPVRSDKRIRCRTTILNVRDLGKRILITVRFKVEIESEKVPALVADCTLLCFNEGQPDPKFSSA